MKKPTGWMSNSSHILSALASRCRGRGGACTRPDGGEHITASGKLAKAVAAYPFELRRAILQGFKAQLTADGYFRRGGVGVQVI